VGGGITPDNAATYLDAGASHVIVTSYVFRDGRLDEDRLKALVNLAWHSMACFWIAGHNSLGPVCTCWLLPTS
jgi:predicted TIM-barrel enzyme